MLFKFGETALNNNKKKIFRGDSKYSTPGTMN